MSAAAGRRPTTPVFAGFAALGLLALAALAHAGLSLGSGRARLAAEADLVRRLGLSDAALFTEARYTRHPALADLNTPFQDHPMGFDHFPSATAMPLPDLPASGRLGFSAAEVAQ